MNIKGQILFVLLAITMVSSIARSNPLQIRSENAVFNSYKAGDLQRFFRV
jgi:hypothetical protein